MICVGVFHKNVIYVSYELEHIYKIMITVIAVCAFCLYVLSVCDTYTWSIMIPLSCVGFFIICCKPCNLNIVQQWVFDVIDTSSFKSPTTHIHTF